MSTGDRVARPRAARVAAQAKVNLRLRILAREESGFHQLETLFLRLALADDLVVRIVDGGRSLEVVGEVDARQLGPVERNLAWRAADTYARATGWPTGFAIELTKRIPVGAGLGGGSADAGAVLRALDALAPSPIGETALRALAATLGADVPFLTTSQPFALGWGRGERLLALPAPPQREVLLVLPAFAVNTADAYGWLASSRSAESLHGVADPLDVASLAQWDSLASYAVNDFEPVVAARRSQISSIVEQLRAAGFAPAMLSGSGSAVFGVFPAESRVDLPQFVAEGRTPAPRVLLTRTAERVEPVDLST
ncbi:MAG TPA: 4-(cytidine 5'-diphospho)-2-C-methyl-D-erythritol kinase [Gemmatimonadaceae bacterium]|jgi:4-diphosphocytidyl-2-C-methyl-D-erythritol kinase|nr:4-(cytidine 5'-diphospho)-2-C-methyl-D-erythritol kinase [Gemmatimonadaceae bacterium]